MPCTKTSRLFAPCAHTEGPVPARICPPIWYQLDQVDPPFVVFLSHRALSVPRTKTSMRPLPGEVAAGDEVSAPPRVCQLDQVAPFQRFHQMALSVPRTKRSRLFEPCAHAAGAPATGAPTKAGERTFVALSPPAAFTRGLAHPAQSEMSTIVTRAIRIQCRLCICFIKPPAS